jgi:hypothetical protein
MIEGSGPGVGVGSIPLTGFGSGSRRPKNMWIRCIRIRIRNTAIYSPPPGETLPHPLGFQLNQHVHVESVTVQPGVLQGLLGAQSAHPVVVATTSFNRLTYVCQLLLHEHHLTGSQVSVSYCIKIIQQAYRCLSVFALTSFNRLTHRCLSVVA